MKRPRQWKGWAILWKARTGRLEPLVFATRKDVTDTFGPDDDKPFRVTITEVVAKEAPRG